MRTFRIIAAAVLALAATAVLAGDVEIIDGVEHVRNAATPEHGVVNMELRELWRVGGADDEENFFGLITQVESDAEGNILVLDGQLCQVQVYSPDGELLRTLFREGDGPGEVRQPRDMIVMPDGRIGLAQEFPGKLILVDEAGDPAGSITAGGNDPTSGGFSALASTACRGGTFAMAGVHLTPGEQAGTQNRRLFFAIHELDGTLRKTLISRDTMFDFNHFVFDERVHLAPFFWAHGIDSEGEVYAVADADAYRIEVFSPTGRPVRVIEREYVQRARTADEKEAWKRLVGGALRNVPFEIDIRVGEKAPCIAWDQGGMRLSPEDELWICSGHGTTDLPEGVMISYDVFERDGNYDRIVNVVCDADGDRDGLFFAGEGRVVVIEGYADAVAATFGGQAEIDQDAEADPMGLICYEIVR